jgi:RNA-binding protein
MSELTPTQRRALKASAHRLHPVVLIGEAGLTPGVLKEIDLALKTHELIKIRVLHEDRERRRGWIEDICRALGCSPVQQIGKILIVYRPQPKKTEPANPMRKRTGKPKRRAKRSYQMQ